MSLSIVLWLFISTFLLGFWLWASIILFKQRQAWRFYAEKKKLRYVSNGLYESPEISGAIGNYTVSAFSSEHSEFDARSQRRLTGIEIPLHAAFPMEAAIASGGMVPVVQGLDLPQEYKPDVSGWDDSYIIRAQDKDVVEAYLMANGRLQKLLQLMTMKRVWVILIFMKGKGLLRIDTSDPLIHPKNLDNMIGKLIEAATVFELGVGEDAGLKTHRKKKESQKSKIKIKSDALDDHGGLQLEDE